MAEVMAEFQRIEQRLIPAIAKAMDRAEREGEELVDHTMRQAIILIVIGLIGYLVATLFIRYVSNKMKISPP
jgi:hypothetical protein